jgi:heavy metal sensor kinase
MTLRARLTAWFTVAVAVAMSLYGTFVYVTVEGQLLAQLERDLHADHERAEGMLVYDEAARAARWDETRGHDGGYHEAPSPVVWITGSGGRTVHRSPEFVDDATTRVAVGRHYVTGTSAAQGDETVTIRVARPLAPLERELRSLLLVLLLGLALGIGVAAGGGLFLAARALRPIGRMAERARTITADRLGERLPVANPKDEVGQLATVFNDTLGRLESAFDRLRRFTADASHELRTPLTAIRAVGEVALRDQATPTACRPVVASMLEEADRLARLVDDLLVLSRADAAQALRQREDVDLDAMVREVASHLAVLAEEKQLTLDVRSPGLVRVRGDAAELRRALQNLLDNAIRYSPTSGTVGLDLEADEGFARICVTDQGPGIAPEHHERIFERFYRVDQARARASGGTGLGLAIASAAVEAHGGRIDLRSAVDHGSTFSIVLPRA